MISKRQAIALLCVGSVLDMATTIVGMEYFALRELNGAAGTLIEAMGYLGLLPLTGLLFVITLGGAAIIEHNEDYGQLGAIVAISAVAGIKLMWAVWNTFLMGLSL